MDRDNPTQFGRALRHLDIEILLAGAGTLGARLRHASGWLPFERAATGITDMDVANRYLREVYMAAFNAEFACPAPEEG